MKICPDCGAALPGLEVIFHKCPLRSVNVGIFLISGIIGIYVIVGLISCIGISSATAIELFLVIFLPIPSGLLGGYGSYRLFKLIKSPSLAARSGFILLSAFFSFVIIIGFLIILLELGIVR